ncbi:MAG: arginine--tRNA ligase [bacterium]|nr:arginine--tRNA ligase [bacterium]
MIRSEIRRILTEVINEKFGQQSELNFSVEVPENEEHGDYSTNAALVLAKILGKKPMEVANEIISKLETRSYKPEAIQPGFINFFAPPEVLYKELSGVLEKKNSYGNSDIGKNKKARVEYISANPTGPIHVGNARGGPLGETIARVLEKSGYEVLREYFHNDAGSQVEKMGKTIWYWYKKELGEETEFPEGGYQGEYPKEIAKKVLEKFGEKLSEKDLPKLTKFGIEKIWEENQSTIQKLGIEFNEVVKESELLSSGKTEKIVEKLKNLGVAKEHDGALWLAPQDEFLEDKEAVLVRSNGQPTYFASDAAYHREKFESGSDLVIDILGSNHHGHVPRLKALAKVFGFDPEKFLVVLYQYVRIKRGKEVINMSKRAGNFVTAREVLDEVGRDSFNFSILLHSANSHIDFDLELAKKQSEENPVYYAQYAYARCCSILNKLQATSYKLQATNFSLLKEPVALGLIKKLLQFPEVVEDAARDFQVQRLPRYATELAKIFHNFYEKCRVITDDESLTQARLNLVLATKLVLKNTLNLLNIDTPEKM